MIIKKVYIFLGLTFLSIVSVFSQVRLPKIFQDGMVLQRNAPIPIWGWSSPEEQIEISFEGKTQSITASENGEWEIEFPEMKAGGPFSIQIKGKNQIEVNDVLVGDVWLCSGQSNMVHQLNIHDVTYADDIKNANYPEVRHFKIPTATSLSGPKDDLPGGEWQKAIGDEVRPFSAVAYFFARKIYDKYQIPIGLVNASVGGTPIESWINETGYEDFPEILETIEQNKDTAYVNARTGNRFNGGGGSPKPSDKGLTGPVKWYEVDFEPKNWRRMNIPGYWEDQGVRNLNGVVWLRREVDIPAAMVGKDARLFMGRIIDADEVYINGKQVGKTTYQYPQRRYDIPKDVLKAGKNVFVVRVTNQNGKGGFVPDKPYYIFSEKDTVDLKGYWDYKVGEVFKPWNPNAFKSSSDKEPPRRINPQNEPTSLYNAMVAPIAKLPVKGVLWYQGESNAGRPDEYKALMNALIDGWRELYDDPELPFIYAQLPNFMDVNYSPEDSNWAELREAQLEAWDDENTAMTVNIDLGEWNDIHPDNKKDVGERMAIAAKKLAYGEDIVYSGPIYKSHEIKDGKIIVSFTHVGSGLVSNDGEPLSEFAIAGDDGEFVWAQAKIEGNKIIVWDDNIQEPKFLRYAWSDNPDNPNLYNKEGLPASPFRID